MRGDVSMVLSCSLPQPKGCTNHLHNLATSSASLKLLSSSKSMRCCASWLLTSQPPCPPTRTCTFSSEASAFLDTMW